MPYKNAGLTLFSVYNGSEQGTADNAQRPAVLINMIKYVILTLPAHDFIGTVAGDPFRCLIPEKDSPVKVDEIDSVIQVIYNSKVQFIHFKFHFICSCILYNFMKGKDSFVHINSAENV